MVRRWSLLAPCLAVPVAVGSCSSSGLGTNDPAAHGQSAPRDASAPDDASRQDASAGATADSEVSTVGDGPGSCSDELAFADPDVEAVVRDLVHISAGPIFTKDVLTLTDLGALLTVVGTCAPNDCGHPNPPAKDDWITSLDGVQCLTAVERIAMDAWSVLDYSPLAALGRLSYLYAGLTLDLALFPVLPAVTQLEVIYTERGLTGLSSFPALESLTVSARDLAGDHALDPLAPLVKLRSVVIARSHVTNLSALAALPRITTLNLARNDIADLSPLLQNGGLGEGDTVDVSENPINCAGQAEILRLLRARGVVVKVDCP